jgi:2-methylisocitrate lyase-like PEP mutase family enzyme
LFLNVIAWPGQVSVDELGKLGVRRVSLGSWIPQTLWAQATQLASNFLQDGLSNPLCADAAPYAQVDAILGDNVQGN